MLNYAGQASLKTTSVALAGSPVTVEPALVQMEWRAADHTRRGEVTLFDRDECSRALRACDLSPGATQSSFGQFGRRASQRVELVLPADDSFELQAPLSVTAAATRLDVPVTAPPAPAWLRVRDAQKLEKSGSVYRRLAQGRGRRPRCRERRRNRGAAPSPGSARLRASRVRGWERTRPGRHPPALDRTDPPKSTCHRGHAPLPVGRRPVARSRCGRSVRALPRRHPSAAPTRNRPRATRCSNRSHAHQRPAPTARNAR